ncbi:hypothetical protein GCM10009118_25690 [Wandonia haliotis]|uniref:Uncharacterized protein n=1 Tax=Wandonia haliotis TaxID=574963 RepID=A0ABP3Y7H3_9FLAO
MKQLILVIVSLLVVTSTFSQKTDCEKIRTGIFYANTGSKKGLPSISVERTETTQKEIIEGEEAVLYDLKWIDSCKFVLEHTEGEDKIRIVVTITKIRKKYYEYTATRLGFPLVTGRMYLEKR